MDSATEPHSKSVKKITQHRGDNIKNSYEIHFLRKRGIAKTLVPCSTESVLVRNESWSGQDVCCILLLYGYMDITYLCSL